MRGRVSRGYFGVGIYAAKTPENVGGLWRSAHAFGASFIFTIGARYPKAQATDTGKAWLHVPLIEHNDVAAFVASVPRGCEVIGVECAQDVKVPTPLPEFKHPERAIYLLGAEDRGLPRDVMADVCTRLVEIPAAICLNVATAGSIVLYDRVAKS